MHRGTPNNMEMMAGDAQEGPTRGPHSPSLAASEATPAVDVDVQLLAKMAAIRRVLGHSVLGNSASND
jgi:hypothetical protein